MSQQRTICLLLLLSCLMLAVAGCAPPEKPTKDGAGPLSIRFDPGVLAPEYHSPLDTWQRVHFQSINDGNILEGDCTYCHSTQTSCDNCHNYVGVNRTVLLGKP
ncbi:MAG: hypothetical protein GX605_02230 [Chloroflexi bacterium]|nr:hypothetical protein [Chloroflexota bacterium]